jgi:hypothetical protein
MMPAGDTDLLAGMLGEAAKLEWPG